MALLNFLSSSTWTFQVLESVNIHKSLMKEFTLLVISLTYTFDILYIRSEHLVLISRLVMPGCCRASTGCEWNRWAWGLSGEVNLLVTPVHHEHGLCFWSCVCPETQTHTHTTHRSHNVDWGQISRSQMGIMSWCDCIWLCIRLEMFGSKQKSQNSGVVSFFASWVSVLILSKF